MFRECLEIAYVDSVLNLVNLNPQRRDPEPEPEAPKAEDKCENCPENKGEDK